MSRMTRRKDGWECRVAGGCPAEEWMYDLYGKYSEGEFCKTCPFEKYINRLAELEDLEEEIEDDRK